MTPYSATISFSINMMDTQRSIIMSNACTAVTYGYTHISRRSHFFCHLPVDLAGANYPTLTSTMISPQQLIAIGPEPTQPNPLMHLQHRVQRLVDRSPTLRSCKGQGRGQCMCVGECLQDSKRHSNLHQIGHRYVYDAGPDSIWIR